MKTYTYNGVRIQAMLWDGQLATVHACIPDYSFGIQNGILTIQEEDYTIINVEIGQYLVRLNGFNHIVISKALFESALPCE